MIESTVMATAETAPFCGTTDGTGGGVWYSFVGTGDGVVVTTCNPATNYDTKIRVYTGSCGALVCVAGNDDDPCGALRSRVSFVSNLGVTYYILVHGFGGATPEHLNCHSIVFFLSLMIYARMLSR